MNGVVKEKSGNIKSDKICRLCVQEESDLVGLFDNKMGSSTLVSQIHRCVGLEVKIQLVENFQIFLSNLQENFKAVSLPTYEKILFKISQEDSLPKQICQKCYQYIHSWIKFKELCQTNNDLLLHYYASPEPEVLLHILSPRGDASIQEDLSEFCQNLFGNQSFLKDLENEENRDFWSKNFNMEVDKVQDSCLLSSSSSSSKVINMLSENKNYNTSPAGEKKHFLPKVSQPQMASDDKNVEFLNSDCLESEKMFLIDDKLLDKRKDVETRENKNWGNGKNKQNLTSVKCDGVGSKVVAVEKVMKDRSKTSEKPKQKHKGKGITVEDCVARINKLKTSNDVEDVEKKKKYIDKYRRYGSLKFVCGVENCVKVVTRFVDLLDHDVEAHHHLPLEHSCEKCGKCFISAHRLDIHNSTQHKKKEFSCDFCSKSFSSRKAYRNHLLEHEKKYVCEHCGVSKLCQASLDTHINFHLKKKQFICDICHQPFSTNSSRKRHIKSIHFLSKNFQCDQCHFKTNISENLSYHKSSKHNSDNFVCVQCGKTYHIYAVYLQHVKSHTRSFTCQDCNRSFKKRSDLKRHQRSHEKINSSLVQCLKCKNFFDATSFQQNHLCNPLSLQKVS